MKIKTFSHAGADYAVLQDGKPVYVDDAGKEIAFDAPGTIATISKLNGEAKSHREAKEAAEAKLKGFDGLDPDAARDALDKLSKIDQKKLIDAGNVDAAVAAAVKPYADKLAAAEKANADLSGNLSRETIGNRFSGSKFATEKLTPAGVDLIRNLYGDQIKVENGVIYGVDKAGNKLLSKARPGEVADFDEVIEGFVDAYPHKDHILQGSGANGGGSGGGGGGGGKDLSALSPTDRLTAARAQAQ